MGSYFTKNMEENMKKNQETMQNNSEIMMERQIQLQRQMLERQIAMQIAGSRDTCLWFTTFYVTVAAGLFSGFSKTKKPALLTPLLPLTFVTLYFWDLAYGNKVHRIRMEAEHIMTHEADYLEWPCGLPSVSSIDIGRLEDEEKKKIHPPLL